MGSIAFAQVTKNENTNKTAARKVLDTDVKDLPQDPEADANTSKIKGYQQKMSATDGIPLKISDDSAGKFKGSTTTQKDNGNKSASDPYLKVTSEKKSNASGNATIKGSGEQSQKSASDPYLKVTSEKKSNASDNSTIKVSGTQVEKSASDPYLKVTSSKKE